MKMQAAFDCLAPFIQEFIYRQSWEELRPLQIEAVDAIINTNKDVLITSGTASGKTEAAFLPILSSINNTYDEGVRVLYVGPLKALINDQFRRLEPLCEMGHIPIFRWHGDVSTSKKRNFLKHPGGILQITPESIESLLINHPNSLKRLFGNLDYAVIDEVHSFLDSDRGSQLQSQLGRLSRYSKTRIRKIGLSATVGDVDIAQKWINPEEPDNVILINPQVDIPPTFLYHLHFINQKSDVPDELIDDLYNLTKNKKAIIFCNNRRFVEQISNKLNRYCDRERITNRYLPHHGSISKELREEAEIKMRDDDIPYSIVCTNTLELGIDVGQLNLIVQIESTHSVMSFVQRLGRTGRKYGDPRIIQIYSLENAPEENDSFYDRIPFSLLKALSIVELYIQGWIEPPVQEKLPYHILYHQILSSLIEREGLMPHDLVSSFYQKGIFSDISLDDFDCLLKHLAMLDHIEQLDNGEIILGLEGEKVARSRDFYAVFQTPPEWNVVFNEKNIGKISPSPDLVPGICLLLGGKLWKVSSVFPEQKQVFVKKAVSAHQVLFSGGEVPDMHPYVSKKVFELLRSNHNPDYLSVLGKERLNESRGLIHDLKLDINKFVEGNNSLFVFPWTGSKIARTLDLLIKYSGFNPKFPNLLFPWVMQIESPNSGFNSKFLLNVLKKDIDEIENIGKLIDIVPVSYLRVHKYDQFLPDILIKKRATIDWIDWNGAKEWVRNEIH